MTSNINPLVLAITGASAQQLATRSLQLLLKNNKSVDLILSKGAYKVWMSELNKKVPIDPLRQTSFWRDLLGIDSGTLTCHKWDDNSASIASGSFKTLGMVIVPCTMGKIARISNGIASDLIERSADVHLKEKRKLIISPRESPFNLIHLRNMTQLCEAGAEIIPSIPSWYAKPKSLDEMIDFMVVRLFDSFGFELKNINRWGSS